MIKTDKNKKIFVFIVLFFSLFSNYIVYTNLHTHHFGAIYIVHGHPYHHDPNHKAQGCNHSHSTAGLLFYASLIHLNTLLGFFFIVFILNLVFEKSFRRTIYFHYQIPTFLSPFLRAPPLN